MSALDIQIGGGHYREGGIQPVQYIEANGLLFLEASVVKRVTRHNRATGKGKQDIEKAIHELQLLLELRYVESAPEWPKDEQRIDAIGQNGNGGEHYGWIEHDGKGFPSGLVGKSVMLRRHSGGEGGPYVASQVWTEPGNDFWWDKADTDAHTVSAYRIV